MEPPAPRPRRAPRHSACLLSGGRSCRSSSHFSVLASRFVFTFRFAWLPASRQRAVRAGDVPRTLLLVELPVLVRVHQHAGLRLLERLSRGNRLRDGVPQLLPVANVGRAVGLGSTSTRFPPSVMVTGPA